MFLVLLSLQSLRTLGTLCQELRIETHTTYKLLYYSNIYTHTHIDYYRGHIGGCLLLFCFWWQELEVIWEIIIG